MNRGEANEESIIVKVKPDGSWFWWMFFENYISLAQVEGLAKEKVMVYEAPVDFSLEELNGINITVWFRILNSQPM